MRYNVEPIRVCVDVAAGVNVIATLVGWLPPIAAGLSIIWTGIQLYNYFKKKDRQ